MVMANTNMYTTRQNKKYKRYRKKSYNVTRGLKRQKNHIGQQKFRNWFMQEVTFDMNSEG